MKQWGLGVQKRQRWIDGIKTNIVRKRVEITNEAGSVKIPA